MNAPQTMVAVHTTATTLLVVTLATVMKVMKYMRTSTSVCVSNPKHCIFHLHGTTMSLLSNKVYLVYYLAAICTGGCQNGGTCTLLETSSCMLGWTGQYCRVHMVICCHQRVQMVYQNHSYDSCSNLQYSL